MIKKACIWITKFIASFVILLMVYMLMAWLLPQIKVNNNFTETLGGIPVYVYSNGVHTDIVVPVNTIYKDWRKEFIPSTFKAVDTTFKYVEIGWGDKAFYLSTPTWADLKVSTAFNALFFLDSAAMHVTYDRYPPKIDVNSCKKVMISPTQYQAMISYIQKSFGSKVVLIPNRGYDLTDNFYQATGHYSFLKTCNVWTGDALKTAGIRQGIWTPFEAGVIKGISK